MAAHDLAALGPWLDAAFGPAPMAEVARVAGGQSNPTWFVTHRDARMVLRAKPLGPILPGAHAIEREFRVLSALHPAGLPVPRPIALCTDPAVIGTPFYLMERVEGRIFADCSLPELPRAERSAIWMGLADALGVACRSLECRHGLGAESPFPLNPPERQAALDRQGAVRFAIRQG
ncbi:MAG: phosphotransferase family protein, partial [Gemmobacter sp.]